MKVTINKKEIKRIIAEMIEEVLKDEDNFTTRRRLIGSYSGVELHIIATNDEDEFLSTNIVVSVED